MVKNPPAMQETWVQSLDWKDTLEKEMATHSSILAWRISWTEEPGGLQSIGLQRVRHDWETKQSYNNSYTDFLRSYTFMITLYRNNESCTFLFPVWKPFHVLVLLLEGIQCNVLNSSYKDNILTFLNIRDSYLNVGYLLVLIDTSYQVDIILLFSLLRNFILSGC